MIGLVEFAAKRRKTQAELEAMFAPLVRRALDSGEATSGWYEVLQAFKTAYAEEYGRLTDVKAATLPSGYVEDVQRAFKKATRSGDPDELTVERTAAMLATNALSAASTEVARNSPDQIELEWVDMDDKAVRPTHREAGGQRRLVGEKFDVGGHKMSRPGDTSAPIEEWINCRCALHPVLIEETLVASADVKKSSTVVVALPAADHPINDMGEEQKHITLAFLGEFPGDPAAIHAAVERAAAGFAPFTASVIGPAALGPDKVKVLLMEAPEIAGLRRSLEDEPEVKMGLEQADSHPHFVPHMTLSYGEQHPPEAEGVEEVAIDRLAVWHGEEQTEYNLAAKEIAEQEIKTAEDVEAALAQFATKVDEPTIKPEDPPVQSTEPEVPAEPVVTETKGDQPDVIDQSVPFYSVWAPEGKKSGDGRRFKPNAVRRRPLPLPLTWQKVSDDGHKGNVVVAKTERMIRKDGEIRAVGHFLVSAEADEVVGLIAEFGRFGLSIDADDAVQEVDEAAGVVDFSDARAASACIVAIPAFHQAFVALGEAPEGFMDGEELVEDAEEVNLEEEVAAALTASALVPLADVFADVAPGRTEDGPGWITDPVPTDRLRDYWSQPGQVGYEKIGWGTGGDFNRCRALTAQYVKPQHLSGYCANRHFDALGYWPGQGPHAAGETAAFAAETLGTKDEPGEALSLVASVGHIAPAPWFMMEEPDHIQPFTVTPEGQVYGHIAEWGVCHIGFKDGLCVDPPRSETEYAHFLTGYVPLDNGQSVATGSLTVGGGHAGPRLSARQAMAHYDRTSTAAADVTVVDGTYGIWCCGWIRPGTSDDMVTALRASSLSGDWRPVAGHPYEMVAALAVNTPGFGIPRPRLAATADGPVSLVAAGVVAPSEEAVKVVAETDIEELSARIAAQVAENVWTELSAMSRRKNEIAAVAASLEGSI